MTVANPDLEIARENFERLAAIRERVYAHACKFMILNVCSAREESISDVQVGVIDGHDT